MQPETFKLEIIAEKHNDGESVKCMTNAKINCDRNMAIGVFVNLFNQDENIKELIAEAMLISMIAENKESDSKDKEVEL
jgi:hypothetical protein